MERPSSRIVKIPKDIQINITNDKIIEIIGPKGKLNIDSFANVKGIKIIKKDDQIFTEIDSKNELKFSGTIIALIKGGIIGVQSGHQKKLVIKGASYKASMEGEKVKFFLGKSHADELSIPEDLKLTISQAGNEITIEGVNEGNVGLMANKIRNLRLPNPYKIKGIYYAEKLGSVKLKAGKATSK
jgi:large subunit ribosomal protein L6